MKVDGWVPKGKLLPGQYSMSDALTKAIEVAAEAYATDAYERKWPEEDRKALNVPKGKDPGRR